MFVARELFKFVHLRNFYNYERMSVATYQKQNISKTIVKNKRFSRKTYLK